MAVAVPNGNPGARAHWIDWLRVGAIVGVFVYHSFRPFDATGWHVKNAETSDVVGAVQIFFSTFGLAVLFLLAGAGVQFALRRRTWQAFLRERTVRLLVPFVVGTLLLSPIQALIEETHRGEATGPLPDYVGWWSAAAESVIDRGVTPTVFGLGYHLWFLGFLFAFSVLCLPVFLALRSASGVAGVRRLAAAVEAAPGSTLVFAVPIAILLLGSALLGIEEHGWQEFGQYLAYLVIGFVLLADPRFLPAVRRDGAAALLVAAVSTAGLAVLDFVGWLTTDTERGLDPRSMALALLFVLEGWASTLIVLNVGLRARALQRPVPASVGDAVLPVYVVHQPVILAIALVVVQWPLWILPKWLVVFGVSLLVTLGIVTAALRFAPTRVLLGARARGSSPAVPSSVQPPVALAARSRPASAPAPRTTRGVDGHAHQH